MTYTVDDDCEDQGMRATKTCMKCHPVFDTVGQPHYSPLKLKGKFYCCVTCSSSYGVQPHPDLPLASVL